MGPLCTKNSQTPPCAILRGHGMRREEKAARRWGGLGGYSDLAPNAAIHHSCLDRRLDATAMHRAGGVVHLVCTAAGVWKELSRMTVGCPKTAQDIQGLVRQGYVAVFPSLGATDMDTMTGSIDVAHIQLQSL